MNNPAKAYLRRYRAALQRAESLQRAIDEARNMAISISVQLKPDKVQTSGGHDLMESAIIRAADATVVLDEQLKGANAVLTEVLEAISAVPDEMQKTVLTLRYVEGLPWISVSERIHYEERMTFMIHGKALIAVNEWLKKSAGKCSCQ